MLPAADAWFVRVGIVPSCVALVQVLEGLQQCVYALLACQQVALLVCFCCHKQNARSAHAHRNQYLHLACMLMLASAHLHDVKRSCMHALAACPSHAC